MFLMDKILSKSNSYQFYKKNYEKSNKEVKKSKKEIKKLKKQVKKCENSKKEIKKLKKQLNNKNIELEEFDELFSNFEDFLIKRYSDPLIHPPFTKNDKKSFLLMEYIADYLASKAENLEDQPLISVIMPAYNREDIIMHSVESVLNQTYSNYELIIVDDASTDGTRDLLKQIDHEKVRVIFHDENKFCAGARNTGLKAAKGEFISYLDSDNLFDERYLAATVGAFLTLPDADAVYTAQYKFETFDEDPFLIIYGTFNKSLLHNYNYIDINSFSHRRSVYEAIGGFDEKYDAVEDWDLFMRMVNNNYKIYSIPVLLSLYYLHAPNRTSNLIDADYLEEISDKNEDAVLKKHSLDKEIDIIIPVYENDDNIEDCVSSILALNLDKVNIIISNNCSNFKLKDKFDVLIGDYVKIVESESNEGFTQSLNQGLQYARKDADVVILSQNASLTRNSLESMQNYAYNLDDCGLVVSQESIKDSGLVRKHVPFSRPVYWCDIAPSDFYKNILNVPMFHDGEVIELKFAPFFCTYIKEDVLNESCGFNFDLKGCSSMRLFSEYVRNVMGLKIYHVSEALVINNLGKDYKIIDYAYENDINFDNLDYEWNI